MPSLWLRAAAGTATDTQNEPNSVVVNPSTSVDRETPGSSDWAWAAFAVFAVFDLAAITWSHMRPRGQRVFHQIPVLVLTVSAVAYYAMASDLGRTAVISEWGHFTRDIFYVRYIQWFINAPLILIEILLVTGLSLSDIVTTAVLSWVAVVCGLVGALTPTRYKWGFYIFGVLSLIYVIIHVLGHARTSTFYGGSQLKGTFFGSALILTFLWLIYPLAWALCEGSSVIGVSGELVWYGVLDIFSGPFFLFFFLWRTRGIDYNALGLISGKATDAGGRGPATAPHMQQVA